MSPSELLPELQQFKWSSREAPIIFDSDIVEKAGVRAAEQRLTDELGKHGAIVRQIRLPVGEDGKKVGLDDYLLTHSREELEGIVWSTSPAKGNYELPIPLADLMVRVFPPTEWVWRDFILKGEVNLLYGDGGVGKSLLALHIGVGVAAGMPLFGAATMQMPVFALFAEDGEAQIQYRVSDIVSRYKLDTGALPMKFWCQPQDTLLAVIDDNGVVKELPRLHALRAELAKIGAPALLILDSLADLFALNESLRLPVNAALKRVLGGLCRDFGVTVIVLAHPSKASKVDGTNYSGSTAFNNAVRQRLTLEVLKTESNDMYNGSLPRSLRVEKSNYGPPAEKTLWFFGPSIEELPRVPVASADEEKQAVLKTVLGLIDKGVRVVNRNGGNNGDGRNLGELAKTIKDQCGITMSAKRVRDHLRSLVDEGSLAYREADNSKRPFVKAGFIRGTRQSA